MAKRMGPMLAGVIGRLQTSGKTAAGLYSQAMVDEIVNAACDDLANNQVLDTKPIEVRLREGAAYIETDGTPSQVGPDPETLRHAADVVERLKRAVGADPHAGRAINGEITGVQFVLDSRGVDEDLDPGTYLTVRVHDESPPVVGGPVRVTFLPLPKGEAP